MKQLKKIGADLTENQPIFLLTNQEKMYNDIKGYNKQLEALNSLRIIYNCDMKTELTEADLREIMTDAKAFVQKKKNEIREVYPFVSANDKFNEEALGITFFNIDKSLLSITDNKFQYLLNTEMTFEVDEKYLEVLKEGANVYATTKEQIEKVTTAEALTENLNKLLHSNVISQYFIKNGFSKIIDYNGAQNIFELDKKILAEKIGV